MFFRNIYKFKIIALAILLTYSHIQADESLNKFIQLEWEQNPLAAEYEIQISNSTNFLEILYQAKIKENALQLEPNPNYLYGRIAGIDEFGVRGEYSEVFEIEQRIVEKKITPKMEDLPSIYLGLNHGIRLENPEDPLTKLFTYYRINDGIWFKYNDGIQLIKEGPNLIQYYTEDRLGNRERIKTKEYILDTKPPQIDAVIANTYTDKEKFLFTGYNSKIDINVHDLYSGLQSVKVFLRTANESVELEWMPNSSLFIPDKFSEKVVELLIVATDRLGNTGKYSQFFKHDLVAPEVSMESFPKMEGQGRKITMNHIRAYDAYAGVFKIYYSLNNSPLQTYLDPILISEPGEYEIKFQAIDNVGNKSRFQYERIFIPEPRQKKEHPITE